MWETGELMFSGYKAFANESDLSDKHSILQFNSCLQSSECVCAVVVAVVVRT